MRFKPAQSRLPATYAASLVDPQRNRLHVKRVNAMSDATQMIERQPLWNAAPCGFIHNSVRRTRRRFRIVSSVSVSVEFPRPAPAIGVSVSIYEAGIFTRKRFHGGPLFGCFDERKVSRFASRCNT